MRIYGIKERGEASEASASRKALACAPPTRKRCPSGASPSGKQLITAFPSKLG